MSNTPRNGEQGSATLQGDLFEALGPAIDVGFSAARWIELDATLTVASGDLVVMGGRSQRDWRHSVPKQASPAGPRISVNFAPARHAVRPG